MKSAKLFALLLIISTSMLFTNCSPRQDDISTTKEILSEGKWSVDYYFAGQDQTGLYTNYTFTFNLNGAVVCEQGTTSNTGTWSLIKDGSRNDVLLIQLNTLEPHLIQLSEEWKVTDQTLSVIAMRDVNSTQLRFKKL